MTNFDTPWYELAETLSGKELEKLVKSDNFVSCASVDEIANVTIECKIPMVKMIYQITDREKNVVKEGEYAFNKDGVNKFVIKDVVDLEELKAYETDTYDYFLQTSVVLVSGVEVGGYFTLQCTLRNGSSTTKIPSTDLKDKLANIPIAKPGMTEDELRKICLEYMRLQLGFTFKFEKDFNYTVVSQKRPRRLIGGKVYAGIPYITRGAGNLYRIASIYDPKTGALDPESDIFDDIRYFGNACSGSASMSWARVVTSAYLGYTMFMTEANGFLPVGSYLYPEKNITRMLPKKLDSNGVNGKSICRFNGEQTMFESYALMKPADGVGCCGHVRMNSAIPTVIRNDDGSIDGDKSFTLMCEQVCYTSNRNCVRIAQDGTHYHTQGFIDIKYSFRDLYEAGYFPFTFNEFINPNCVQPARIRLSVEPTLGERVLTSNYAISDVFAELDGKRYAFHNMEFFRKEVKMSDIFPEEILSDKTKVSVQLYNGELIFVDQNRF